MMTNQPEHSLVERLKNDLDEIARDLWNLTDSKVNRHANRLDKIVEALERQLSTDAPTDELPEPAVTFRRWNGSSLSPFNGEEINFLREHLPEPQGHSRRDAAKLELYTAEQVRALLAQRAAAPAQAQAAPVSDEQRAALKYAVNFMSGYYENSPWPKEAFNAIECLRALLTAQAGNTVAELSNEEGRIN